MLRISNLCITVYFLSCNFGDAQAVQCPPSGCPAGDTDETELIQNLVKIAKHVQDEDEADLADGGAGAKSFIDKEEREGDDEEVIGKVIGGVRYELEFLEGLRKIFDNIDEDGSGELELEDIYQGMLKESPTRDHRDHQASILQTLKKMIMPDDRDGNGALSFDEFVLLHPADMPPVEPSYSNSTTVSLLEDEDALEDDEERGVSEPRLIQQLDEQRKVSGPGPIRQFGEEGFVPGPEPIQQVDEEREVSGPGLIQQFSEENDQSRRRRKNKKQKEWAAKMMMKADAKVCTRATTWVGSPKDRQVRHMSCSVSWGGVRCGCSGWDQIGTLCYRKCHDQFGSNYHGVGHRCWPGCPSGYINGRIAECHERCGEAQRLPHTPVECHGWIWCADSWGTCEKKAFDVVASFAMFAMNMVGPAKAGLKAAKGMAKGASRLAKIGAAVKKIAKVLLKKARKKLIKYAKKRAKEEVKAVKKDIRDMDWTMEAIFEGGADAVAAGVIGNREPDLAQEALDVLDAVDPTGISGIVNAFHAGSCNNIKIDAMPLHGLEDEEAAAAAAYTERSLVANEGNDVTGSISPLTSMSDCMQACTSNPSCNSFAVCQSRPSGCWMKDKVVTMSDPPSTSSENINTRQCKTWFKTQA